MDEDEFDVAVLGTGLPEAIVAAALARKGFSVLQLDPSPWYGGAWASLSLDELVSWARTRRHVVEFAGEEDRMRRRSRQYALPLLPTLLPASSPFVDTLVASGVCDYVNFRLIQGVGVFEEKERRLRRVPAGKEDVFKDPTLSLVDKRRLMKFLMWVAQGERSDIEPTSMLDTFLSSPPHSLPAHLSSLIATLSLSPLPISSTPTLSALDRLKRTLLSLNRFGSSPYLVGQYGGSGEWVGGFARAAAVRGATQVVGREVTSAKPKGEGEGWEIEVGTGEEAIRFSAKRVIAADDSASVLARSPSGSDGKEAIARAIVVLSGPLDVLRAPSDEASAEWEARLDNILVVFPEGALVGNVNPVTALVLGDGAMACPDGEKVLCLSTLVDAQSDPEPALRPALDALLAQHASSSPPAPLFSLFYSQTLPPLDRASSHPAPPQDDLVIMPPLGTDPASATVLTASADWAARVAEETVRRVTGDDEVWDKDTGGQTRDLEEEQ